MKRQIQQVSKSQRNGKTDYIGGQWTFTSIYTVFIDSHDDFIYPLILKYILYNIQPKHHFYKQLKQIPI